MLSIIIALIVAVVFGLWGYGKRLYPVWAFAFNVIIAVYLGVMLTPTILEIAGERLKSLGAYDNVTVMTAAALLYFLIAQLLCTKYQTGTYCVSFHKSIDNIGGLIFGFAGGFLIANFILFAIAVSPLKENPLVSKYLPAGMEKASGRHIVNACEFVSSCSLQYGDKSISTAIEVISRSDAQNPPKAAEPKVNPSDSNQTTTSPPKRQPQRGTPDLNE
jgi:uncharacterized membrane protein required for colicin V production